jgi:IMP dehydrogenase
MSIGDHLCALSKLLQNESYPIIGCIGVGDNGKRRAEAILPHCGSILIDIAHGHSDSVAEQIKWLQKQSNKPIIAGNVATSEGAEFLLSQGVDAVQVGVGCGHVCKTRIATGCGVPQATAILNVKRVITKHHYSSTLIADGGIRSSGDIVKSLALGADTVMIGSLLAGTTEALGKIVVDKGIPKKMYRGMASQDAQESWKGMATSVEGETVYVPFKGDVERIFNDLIAGILSGMSYQNAKNLTELRENAKFIRQTSAGYVESGVYE